jgi:hypothetical protein
MFCCNCKKVVPDNHLSVTRKPVIDEHWYLTDDYPHPVKHWKEATYMGADCFEAGVKKGEAR